MRERLPNPLTFFSGQSVLLRRVCLLQAFLVERLHFFFNWVIAHFGESVRNQDSESYWQCPSLHAMFALYRPLFVNQINERIGLLMQ